MSFTATVQALTRARERTLALVASVSDADLERVHSTLMSPLVWDLGHIAAFEDLWLVHRFGGRSLLHAKLTQVYDAFETPRADRGDLPFLPAAAAREYLAAVRERTLAVIDERGVGDWHELVLRHEQQHNETMLQTLQLAGLDGYRLDGPLNHGTSDPAAVHAPSTDGLTGLELVDVAGGPCTVGAAPEGFAYDNERPRHHTDVRAFAIGRVPITNATYLHFVEGGGYERREWWSDEGWAWKEQYDITRPGGWTADHSAERRLGTLVELSANRPVVHLSWFEADAFARAHDARLPTEFEWEKAATWDEELGLARPYPWGENRAVPHRHGNVDQLGGGPARVGAYPAGSSPCWLLGMIGDVWEWTASEFRPYPGFVANPYREYSEPFFGPDYKVLRGGSWATSARVATPTFRNWDYPNAARFSPD